MRLPGSVLPAAIMTIVLCAPTLRADVTARVSGVIRDQQGAVIPGAKIILTNEATGLQRQLTANATGEYLILEVPVGSYRMEVEASGFRKYVQAGIGLSVNQSARNDVVLAVGELSQQVTVEENVGMVDTSVSELKQTVDSARMREIPLAGRNVLALAGLMPGVIITNQSLLPGAMPNGVGGDQTRLYVNGNRYAHNMFELDGADFTGTAYAGQPGRYPSPDAVEEFTILTNAYKAEFGQGAAVVNAVSKSGTNEFHGAGWEFVRNNNLNARNFFGGPTTNKYQYNQFGTAVGGPVLKNRTFFFFTYEGLRGRLGASPSTSIVPTAAQRSGDLSSISKQLVDPSNSQPFPGNVIPTSRLDPVAQKVMSLFVPAPNATLNQYIFAFPTHDDYNEYLFKVDHSITDRSRLSVRGLTSFGQNVTALSPFPGFVQSQERHPSNLTVAHTQVFSPTKLNEFRATIQRIIAPTHREQGNPTTSRDLGFLNNPVPFTTYMPSTSVAGYFGVGSSSGLMWLLENKYVAQDAFSIVHGRHAIKLGGEFKRSRYAEWGEYGTRGGFSFSGELTGNALGDYLIGLPASYGQRSPMNFSNSNYSMVGYAQDDFRMTSRLTLNLGFRYEFHANPKEREGKDGFWVPGNFATGVRSSVFPNAPPGMLFVGDQGMPDRGGWNQYSTWGVLGPRFGFAYDLFGNGKTTVRAAFGIFNVPMDLQMIANSTETPPFDMIVSLEYPPSYANPFQGRTDPYPTWKPKMLYDMSKLLPMVAYPNYLGYRNGYSEQWNFTVERELKSDVKLSLSYVGMHGLALWRYPQINPGQYIPGVDASGQPLSSVTNTNARRPFAPYYSGVYLFESDASRKSNAMQLVLQKRFSRGLTIMGSYALSNTMAWWDDGHNGFVQDTNNNFANYARADTDIRNRMVVSWIYDLPKFTANRSIGMGINGWEVSGSFTAQSGFPYDVVTGTDNSRTGIGRDRPNLVGDWTMPSDRSKADVLAQYFNTQAFAQNAIGQFGNLGRNALRGPGLVNCDFGLFKNFPITERHKVQFRVEGFNGLNRANFTNPVARMASPTFGTILGAGPARIMQFGLKYLF